MTRLDLRINPITKMEICLTLQRDGVGFRGADILDTCDETGRATSYSYGPAYRMNRNSGRRDIWLR